jgi:hypothetical protein
VTRLAALSSSGSSLPGVSSLVTFHLDPSEMALGISAVQGFVPSVQRHSTRRRALPPCRWCLRHSPGFPGCHGADPRLRGLLPQRRCRVPRVVLPTLGSRSPLQVLSSSGTRISLLASVDRSRRFRPLMALVLRTSSCAETQLVALVPSPAACYGGDGLAPVSGTCRPTRGFEPLTP